MRDEFLIQPAWLAPVIPTGLVLADQVVKISQGRIAAIKPKSQGLQLWPGLPVVELPHHVLLPGLVNMHTHSAMSLFRGYADDMPLQTWLNDHIWPAEGQVVGPEFVRDGTELSIAEMIRGGTTCFNDNYFFPNMTATAAFAAGMRAVVGIPIIDFPTRWAKDSTAYFQRGAELQKAWADSSLVKTSLAPHAPYSVNDNQLKRIRLLANEWDLPVHMHLLETPLDNEHSLEHFGESTLARLQRLGILNSRLIAVHMTWVAEEEFNLLADSGVQIVHCPESNLKLASGLCPVVGLQAAGLNISIGTDGAASNNDLDLLGEAKTAALLAKGVSGDPEAVNAVQALEMITINGARALGLESEIGSIEVGKSADLMAMDLSGVNTQPLHNVISQVIYAGSAAQVDWVWVQGRALLKNRCLTTLNEGDILAKARQWQEQLTTIHEARTG